MMSTDGSSVESTRIRRHFQGLEAKRNASTEAPLTPPIRMYNPISHYTPQRTPRKEIMGMSILARPPEVVRSDSIDDDSYGSLGSLDRLERRATRIRSQLRLRQLQEISLEAEKAAEAGEESFRAHPITYDGEQTLPATEYKQPAFSWPISNKTLRVADLRDATTVFPSFANLHKNVRTHLKRQGVQRITFEERPNNASSGAIVRHSFGCPIPDFERRTMFPRFALGLSWSDDRERIRDDEAPLTPSEILADHLHDPTRKPRRRPIQVPKGLEIPSLLQRSSSLELCSNSEELLKPIRPERSSSDTGVIHALKRVESPISPKALFDEELSDDESLAGLNISKAATDPLTPSESLVQPLLPPPKQFMTPARLRGIRNASAVSDQCSDHKSIDDILLPKDLGESSANDGSGHLFAGLDTTSQSSPHGRSSSTLQPQTNLSDLSQLILQNSKEMLEDSEKDLELQEASALSRPDVVNEKEDAAHDTIDDPFLAMISSNGEADTKGDAGDVDTLLNSSRNFFSNQLFVSDDDNDSFLQNYLYRSRLGGDYTKVGADSGCVPVEGPCDVDFQCSAENAGCCFDLLPNIEGLVSRRSKGTKLLARDQSKSRLVRETWYDAANERIDGVLENLMGRLQPQEDWSQQFDAPMLQRSLDDIPVGMVEELTQHSGMAYIQSEYPDEAVEEKKCDEEPRCPSPQNRSTASWTHRDEEKRPQSATVLFVDEDNATIPVDRASSY